MTSRLPGFHKLTAAERRALLAKHVELSPADLDALEGKLPTDIRDRLVENAVGAMAIPLGIATNFIVNGREVLVPMAIEESSVIAAASHGAKLARKRGGFVARAGAPTMVAQIQLVDVPDFIVAQRNVHASSDAITRAAREASGGLEKRGGGFRGYKVRTIDTAAGKCLVVHLMVDVRDAMGANAVNSVAEAVAPVLAEVTGGRALLRILTNLADERVTTVSATFDATDLGGPQVARDIVRAYAFADADAYRASTHNKGIMNGVDAVVVATGNDWRAVEAGAHAYAARTGRYRSLSTFTIDPNGDLVSTLALPLALGIVGGVTRVHPTAQAALKLMNVKTAGELAEIVASVGLAQNLSALRALVTDGIQEGHMRLHATNLALAAGVPADRVDEVVAEMMASGDAPAMTSASAAWARIRTS